MRKSLINDLMKNKNIQTQYSDDVDFVRNAFFQLTRKKIIIGNMLLKLFNV